MPHEQISILEIFNDILSDGGTVNLTRLRQVLGGMCIKHADLRAISGGGWLLRVSIFLPGPDMYNMYSWLENTIVVADFTKSHWSVGVSGDNTATITFFLEA